MALRMFLAVVLGLVLSCTGALAASIPCYINEDTVIYSYPGDSSQALSVPSGLPCEMTAVHGDWAMVTRSGANAFIPLKYLTLAQPIDARAVEAHPPATGPRPRLHWCDAGGRRRPGR